ncbi:MAG: hypothetical protein L3J26_03865 [Candidatus Polarisedimenticolaceae bacterium]|nr:hypothetical protein [Candidatus Polarisedimenticolaceae bacterium]
MRHIELNPVRAGMVEYPRATERWSAYRKPFRAAISRADLEAMREATQ